MGWASTIDEAQQISALKNRPYAIYFATKEEFPVIGEARDSIRDFAAANNNTLPTSVFEFPKVIDHLRSMGVVEFAKIAVNKENRELIAKYEADKSVVVVLAPDGRRIGSWSVAAGNLNTMVAQARVTLAAWQNQFGVKKP